MIHSCFLKAKQGVTSFNHYLLVRFFLSGNEDYDNQRKYASAIFSKLGIIRRKGLVIDGKIHDIDVVSCCDWKAAACIGGTKGNSCYSKGEAQVNLGLTDKKSYSA